MARTLELETSVYALSSDDVAAAFERAASGRPAILSCFDHDYRDIADRVDGFRALVADVAARYPQVPWRYAGPLDAGRRFLGAPRPPALELEAAVSGGAVHIWSSAPLFQPTPWIAVRRGDEVEHVVRDVLRLDERHWCWTPDGDWAEAAVDLGALQAVRRVGGGAERGS